jgi:AraC-like DNA-binding protein
MIVEVQLAHVGRVRFIEPEDTHGRSLMDDDTGSLPKIYTPEEVARHFGCSPRTLREKARAIGACRILGNRMVLTQDDVANVLEAIRPPVKPDPASGYERLLKLRAAKEKKSRQ